MLFPNFIAGHVFFQNPVPLSPSRFLNVWKNVSLVFQIEMKLKTLKIFIPKETDRESVTTDRESVTTDRESVTTETITDDNSSSLNVSEMNYIEFDQDFDSQKAAIDNHVCIFFHSIVIFDEENQKITWNLMNDEQLISKIVAFPKNFTFFKERFYATKWERKFPKTHVVVFLEYLHEHRAHIDEKDMLQTLSKIGCRQIVDVKYHKYIESISKLKK